MNYLAVLLRGSSFWCFLEDIPSNHFHNMVFRTTIAPWNIGKKHINQYQWDVKKVQDMKATNPGWKNCGTLRSIALISLGYYLAGCSSPVSPPPKANVPNEVRNAPAQTVRAIIYFQRPTADSSPLFAVISDACQCTPIFIRPYLSDALIYEFALPQGQTFVSFEKTLMEKASALGVKAVEQDALMQHQ